MNLLPLLIIIPLLGAIIVLLMRSCAKPWHDAVTFITLIALSVIAVLVQTGVVSHGMMVFNPGSVVPGLGTIAVADGLTGLMLITINTVITCMVIFSIDYINRFEDSALYYFLILMTTAGLNGVLISGDLFTLYVFMEIAVISAYVLTAFTNEPESLEASFKYAVIGGVSSLLILCAIAFIYAETGSLSFHEIAIAWNRPEHFLTVLVMVLLIVGFGIKSTLIPFSSWVPDAYTAAPAPVAGIFSGAVSKVVGIYALMRLLYNIFGFDAHIMSVVGWLAVASIIIGVTLALYQWNFKRLLAYHSISQIGYMILGLSLGTPLGIAGGLMHLINHSVFKPLLFLNAGSIEHTSNATTLKDMGGLAQRMPVTGATSLIASLSISGIPPFNGFWSKLLIIFACVQSGKFGFAVIAVAGSILTLASFTKVQRYAFMGPLNRAAQSIGEATMLMRLSMIILAVLCVSMGVLLLPGVYEVFLEPAVRALTVGRHYGVAIEKLLQ
ncbi:MAG: proton-conducting transporter membrane subunit [Elusimicrobiota bacterium]